MDEGIFDISEITAMETCIRAVVEGLCSRLINPSAQSVQGGRLNMADKAC